METVSAINPESIKGLTEVSASGVSIFGRDIKTRPDDDIEQKSDELRQKAHDIKDSTNIKISRIAEAMDSYVQSIRRDLKIQVHGDTGNIMVEVISESDGKVIREIPPKELLDLAAKMEDMTGALFNETA